MAEQALQGPCCSARAWHDPPTPFLRSNQRFRFGQNHSCKMCPYFNNSVPGQYLHLMLWLGGHRVQRALLPVCIEYQALTDDFCPHQFRKTFKTLTGAAKRGGDFGHPFWRYLCYWEMSLGYLEYTPLSEMEGEVRAWLVEPNHNGTTLPERKWYHQQMYLETKRFLQENWHRPQNLTTLDEWLAKGSWMRGKGGTGYKTDVFVDGKRIRTRRNKGVDAVFQSNELVKQNLFGIHPQQMIVMQKSEGAKIRPVVKTDNEGFRKMDFLSETIERGLYNCTRSSLFMGASGNNALDMRILDGISDGINVPLDQGSFDNHQGRPSILAVMLAMYDVVIDNEPDEDYKRVWESMFDSFTHPDSAVILGSRRFPWGNGVASGWRWTALLDTLLNIASYEVLTRLAAKSGPFAYWGAVHQGDDIIFKANSVDAVNYLIQLYNRFGYEVHPDKTFISKTRSEFLRRAYGPEGVTGYPARTIQGLLYKNPIRPQPMSSIARVYDRMSVLELLVSRGADPEACAAYLIEDSAQLGIDAREVADFCTTPNSVGGGGLGDEGGSLGTALRKRGTGRWMTPKITEANAPKVKFELGAWAQRVRNCNFKMDSDEGKAFSRDLALTWGIPNIRLWGQVSSEFEQIEKLTPLSIEGSSVIPPPSKIWTDDNIPTILRPHWKRQVLGDSDYIRYIKPEFRGMLATLRSKCSNALLEKYLLGELSMPTPVIKNVNVKYNYSVKQKYEDLMYAALDVNNNSIKKFTRRMLWLEDRVRTGMEEMLGKHQVYAF